MINVNKLSKKYKVRKLDEIDSPLILKLQQSNPLYFEYCPPRPSMQSVLRDLTALPPGKKLDDLYYVGFFEKECLVAILHFITSYPTTDTIFIGLFMMQNSWSGHGIGSRIITEALDYFKAEGFLTVRLGYMKENPQAKAFWAKCGFIDIDDADIETKNKKGTITLLEKQLGSQRFQS